MSTDPDEQVRSDAPGDADASPEPKAPRSSRDALMESDVIEMLGGVRGVIESSVAGVVFALAYSVSGQNLRVSLWAAILSGLAVLVVSLVQRRSVQQAISGFAGILLMALVARLTGKPQNFYLPGILKNGAFAAAYLISILVRWPLIGVVLGPILGEGTAWRRDPRRLRAYSLASAVWMAMFAIRFAVQLPLYLAGKVGWLGFQAIPLGLPLFLLVCWLTFLILVRVPLATRDDEKAEETGSASAEEPAAATDEVSDRPTD